MLIKKQLSEHVLELRINRPEVKGALSRDLVSAISKELDEVLQAIPPRCIVLSSEGTVFSAGADLKERKLMNQEDIRNWLVQLHALMDKIENLPIPVIVPPVPMPITT
mgnify:CR=1 FL=1